MSKVRLCAEVLPDRRQCTQFALRNQLFCRNHAESKQRVRTAVTREIIAMIPSMDLFEVAVTCFDVLYELRRKSLPPLHAQSVLGAAAHRLEHIMAAEAPAHFAAAEAAAAAKSQPGNGLHAVPMK